MSMIVSMAACLDVMKWCDVFVWDYIISTELRWCCLHMRLFGGRVSFI